jgi:hypothetical protein
MTEMIGNKARYEPFFLGLSTSKRTVVADKTVSPTILDSTLQFSSFPAARFRCGADTPHQLPIGNLR